MFFHSDAGFPGRQFIYIYIYSCQSTVEEVWPFDLWGPFCLCKLEVNNRDRKLLCAMCHTGCLRKNHVACVLKLMNLQWALVGEKVVVRWSVGFVLIEAGQDLTNKTKIHFIITTSFQSNQLSPVYDFGWRKYIL